MNGFMEQSGIADRAKVPGLNEHTIASDEKRAHRVEIDRSEKEATRMSLGELLYFALIGDGRVPG